MDLIQSKCYKDYPKFPDLWNWMDGCVFKVRAH